MERRRGRYISICEQVAGHSYSTARSCVAIATAETQLDELLPRLLSGMKGSTDLLFSLVRGAPFAASTFAVLVISFR